MTRLRPGWLVALSAAILSVDVWLPWLISTADGGGHANAIGGSVGSLDAPSGFGFGQGIVLLAALLLVLGAMAGRGLFSRTASVLALAVSLLIAGLIAGYYRQYVVPPVAAGYALYVAAASTVGATCFALWGLCSATPAD